MAHSQGRHSLPHDEAEEEEENIGMDRHCSLFRMMINDYFDGADAYYGDNRLIVLMLMIITFLLDLFQSPQRIT